MREDLDFGITVSTTGRLSTCTITCTDDVHWALRTGRLTALTTPSLISLAWDPHAKRVNEVGNLLLKKWFPRIPAEDRNIRGAVMVCLGIDGELSGLDYGGYGIAVSVIGEVMSNQWLIDNGICSEGEIYESVEAV